MLPCHKFVSYFLKSEGFPEINARFFHPFNSWLNGGFFSWKGLVYNAEKTYCTDILWQLESVISMYNKLKTVINPDVKLIVNYYVFDTKIKQEAQELIDLYELKDFYFIEPQNNEHTEYREFYFNIKANEHSLIQGGQVYKDRKFKFTFDSTQLPYVAQESNLLNWVENFFDQYGKPVCFVFTEKINKEIVEQAEKLRNKNISIHLTPKYLEESYQEFSECYVMSLVLFVDKNHKTKRGYNSKFFKEINILEQFEKSKKGKEIDFFNTDEICDAFNNPEKYFIFNPSRIFSLGIA